MNFVYWTNKCQQLQILYSLAYKKFRLFYEKAGIPSKQLESHSMRTVVFLPIVFKLFCYKCIIRFSDRIHSGFSGMEARKYINEVPRTDKLSYYLLLLTDLIFTLILLQRKCLDITDYL